MMDESQSIGIILPIILIIFAATDLFFALVAIPKPSMRSPTPDLHGATRGEFWFEDGSVIIILQDTAFRVHKSVLSLHSDVFADLFTVPQPVSGDSNMDRECAIVHLPDNVNDFVDALRALYQPFYFDELPSDADLSTLIDFVSGILKISTKYNLITLRQKCISVLKTKFPSTLQGADLLVASGTKYISSTVVRAIPLARETNVPEILPWAFYISANIARETLLEDLVLEWRDKALCLAGKERLWEMLKTRTHRFLFDSSPSLTSMGGYVRSVECRSMCLSKLPQMMSWRRSEELRATPYPLHEFDEWDSLKVCGYCVEQTQWVHRTEREKVWESLPEIFHLGSWDDIRQEQNR